MKKRQAHAFISSVITGMEEVRALTAECLASFGIRVLTWENGFDGVTKDQRLTPQQACLAVVSRSDLVVALLGRNYGEVQKSTGLSPTHEEIRFAIRKGKDLIVLINKDEKLDERQQQLVDEAGDWADGRRFHKTSFGDRGAFKLDIHDILTEIGPVVELSSPATLTEDEAMAAFNEHKHTAIAQCGAFLAGDWSILGHGKALLVPIDARVRVTMGLAPTKTRVDAYERSDSLWKLHEGHSRRMSAVVARALGWTAARSRFPWLPHAIEVTCFSEVPLESGAHEDAAFCISLADCLVRAAQRPEEDILPLGGAFLSRWYPQVSWATLLRSYIADEPGRHALLISRSVRNMDLRKFVLGKASNEEITRNALQGYKECVAEPLHFDVGRISLWVGESASVDIAESIANYRRAVSSLDYILTKRIIAHMISRLRNGSTGQKLGWLMQMHQLALAEAGFVTREYQRLLSHISGLPGVFGAKASCSRGSGAILLFTHKPVEKRGVLHKSMIELGLTPVSLYSASAQGVIPNGQW